MKTQNDSIMLSCGCLIFNDKNEVLLLKRSKNVEHEPGIWSQPGGKIEFGETAHQAVVREIKEELGVDIDILKFLEYTDHIVKDKKHHLALGFLGKIKSGKVQNREPKKHEEFRWFQLDELPKDLTPYTKNTIDSYLRSQPQVRDYWSFIE